MLNLKIDYSFKINFLDEKQVVMFCKLNNGSYSKTIFDNKENKISSDYIDVHEYNSNLATYIFSGGK